MIRPNDISLSWPCFAFFVAVIAVAGCDKAPSGATPSLAHAPTSLEPTNPALAEPTAKIAEPEMASSTDIADSDGAPTVAEQPASSESKPANALPAPTPAPAPNVVKTPKVALTVPDPPEYVYEPKVLMTERDADSCLVKTGGEFPVAQLSDLEGQSHSLKELFGEKLTVVVFWANDNRLGREQIQRLEAETVVPFDNAGLNVIAINIGDPPEQIVDLLPTDRKIGFTILLDTDRALFSKVATGRHPRTYLLDAEGKILWFDIEYSRGTARDLANAIHVYLGDHKVSDS